MINKQFGSAMPIKRNGFDTTEPYEALTKVKELEMELK